ncbi:MAG: DUF6364 family protein [Candidatus Bathyarchaeia archaeon]
MSITLDALLHEEAKEQAKKEGTNLSRLIEWLLKKHLGEEAKKEEMRKREEQLKRESADKGKLLAERFMRKLLTDTEYRSDEWIPAE